MFLTLLSLSVVVISTASGAFSVLHFNGMQKLLRIADAVGGAIDKEVDTRLSSRLHEELERVRSKRADDYSPYTSNPYDAGPIDMCSYPELDACDFPAGYTVPEYAAREVSDFNDLFNTIDKNIRSVDTSACANSVLQLICRHSVPRCISNTTVKYPGNFMTVRYDAWR